MLWLCYLVEQKIIFIYIIFIYIFLYNIAENIFLLIFLDFASLVFKRILRILIILSSQPAKLQKKQCGGVYFCVYGTAFSMPIQQKLPPPVLLFSDSSISEESEKYQQQLG